MVSCIYLGGKLEDLRGVYGGGGGVEESDQSLRHLYQIAFAITAGYCSAKTVETQRDDAFAHLITTLSKFEADSSIFLCMTLTSSWVRRRSM